MADAWDQARRASLGRSSFGLGREKSPLYYQTMQRHRQEWEVQQAAAAGLVNHDEAASAISGDSPNWVQHLLYDSIPEALGATPGVGRKSDGGFLQTVCDVLGVSLHLNRAWANENTGAAMSVQRHIPGVYQAVESAGSPVRDLAGSVIRASDEAAARNAELGLASSDVPRDIAQFAIDSTRMAQEAMSIPYFGPMDPALYRVGSLSSFWKSYQNRRIFTDFVMKHTEEPEEHATRNFAMGFALDVILDPLNALTLGLGKGAQVGATQSLRLASGSTKLVAHGAETLSATRWGQRVFNEGLQELWPKLRAEYSTAAKAEGLTSVDQYLDRPMAAAWAQEAWEYSVKNHDRLAANIIRQSGEGRFRKFANVLAMPVGDTARNLARRVLPKGRSFGYGVDDMFQETASFLGKERGSRLLNTANGALQNRLAGRATVAGLTMPAPAAKVFAKVFDVFDKGWDAPPEIVNQLRITERVVAEELGEHLTRYESQFKALSKEQRTQIGDIIEAREAHLAGAPASFGNVAGYKPELEAHVEFVKREMDDILSTERQAGYGVGRVKSYISRVYRLNPAMRSYAEKVAHSNGVDDWNSVNRYTQQRTIANIFDGRDAFDGSVPITDVYEILRIRRQASVEMIHRGNLEQWIAEKHSLAEVLYRDAVNGVSKGLLKGWARRFGQGVQEIIPHDQVYESAHGRLTELGFKKDNLDHTAKLLQHLIRHPGKEAGGRLSPEGILEAEELGVNEAAKLFTVETKTRRYAAPGVTHGATGQPFTGEATQTSSLPAEFKFVSPAPKAPKERGVAGAGGYTVAGVKSSGERQSFKVNDAMSMLRHPDHPGWDRVLSAEGSSQLNLDAAVSWLAGFHRYTVAHLDTQLVGMIPDVENRVMAAIQKRLDSGAMVRGEARKVQTALDEPLRAEGQSFSKVIDQFREKMTKFLSDSAEPILVRRVSPVLPKPVEDFAKMTRRAAGNLTDDTPVSNWQRTELTHYGVILGFNPALMKAWSLHAIGKEAPESMREAGALIDAMGMLANEDWVQQYIQLQQKHGVLRAKQLVDNSEYATHLRGISSILGGDEIVTRDIVLSRKVSSNLLPELIDQQLGIPMGEGKLLPGSPAAKVPDLGQTRVDVRLDQPSVIPQPGTTGATAHKGDSWLPGSADLDVDLPARPSEPGVAGGVGMSATDPTAARAKATAVKAATKDADRAAQKVTDLAEEKRGSGAATANQAIRKAERGVLKQQGLYRRAQNLATEIQWKMDDLFSSHEKAATEIEHTLASPAYQLRRSLSDLDKQLRGFVSSTGEELGTFDRLDGRGHDSPSYDLLSEAIQKARATWAESLPDLPTVDIQELPMGTLESVTGALDHVDSLHALLNDVEKHFRGMLEEKPNRLTELPDLDDPKNFTVYSDAAKKNRLKNLAAKRADQLEKVVAVRKAFQTLRDDASQVRRLVTRAHQVRQFASGQLQRLDSRIQQLQAAGLDAAPVIAERADVLKRAELRPKLRAGAMKAEIAGLREQSEVLSKKAAATESPTQKGLWSSKASEIETRIKSLEGQLQGETNWRQDAGKLQESYDDFRRSLKLQEKLVGKVIDQLPRSRGTNAFLVRMGRIYKEGLLRRWQGGWETGLEGTMARMTGPELRQYVSKLKEGTKQSLKPLRQEQQVAEAGMGQAMRDAPLAEAEVGRAVRAKEALSTEAQAAADEATAKLGEAQAVVVPKQRPTDLGGVPVQDRQVYDTPTVAQQYQKARSQLHQLRLTPHLDPAILADANYRYQAIRQKFLKTVGSAPDTWERPDIFDGHLRPDVGAVSVRVNIPKATAKLLDSLHDKPQLNQLARLMLGTFDAVQNLYKANLIGPWGGTMLRNSYTAVAINLQKHGFAMFHPQRVNEWAKLQTYIMARWTDIGGILPGVKGYKSDAAKLEALGEQVFTTANGRQTTIRNLAEHAHLHGVFHGLASGEVLNEVGLAGFANRAVTGGVAGALAGAAVGTALPGDDSMGWASAIGGVTGALLGTGALSAAARLGSNSTRRAMPGLPVIKRAIDGVGGLIQTNWKPMLRAGESLFEAPFRTMFFLNEFMDHGSMYEAGQQMFRHMNDYHGLSDIERRFLKRAMPFYSWAKNAVRQTYHAILEEPGKVHATMLFFKDWNKAHGADPEDMPDFYDEKFTMVGGAAPPDPGLQESAKYGYPEKPQKYGKILSGFAMPMEDVAAMAAGLLPSRNPEVDDIKQFRTQALGRGPFGVSAIAEYFINEDSFTGREIQGRTEMSKFQDGDVFEAAPGWLKSLVDYRPATANSVATVNPRIAWMMGKTPYSRFFKMITEVSELDQDSKRKVNWMSYSRALLGINAVTVEPGTGRYFRNDARIRAMANLLATGGSKGGGGMQRENQIFSDVNKDDVDWKQGTIRIKKKTRNKTW